MCGSNWRLVNSLQPVQLTPLKPFNAEHDFTQAENSGKKKGKKKKRH